MTEKTAATPPTEEQIRKLAYRKWEEAGHPSGDGVEFWLAAERELAGEREGRLEKEKHPASRAP